MRELDAEPVAPDAMFCAMRAYILPQRREAEPADAAALTHDLWDKHRIQIAASAFQGKLLCRLSAQIYNEPADFARLVDVLRRDGWAGH